MKVYGKLFVVSILSLFIVFISCKKGKQKILFIDSYHQGYEWSDGITKGVESVLIPAGVELKIFRMDTKNNASEDFAKQAALKAKELIESYKPDVVIAGDDNASKYIIVPYYKNSKIPFVFCGINWDASIYGFPTKNITGMIEVAPIPELVGYLKVYSKGDRIGFITGDTGTGRKEALYNKKLFNLTMKEYFIKTFEEFKTEYKKAQEENDSIIFHNNAGIKDWDDKAGKDFVLKNTKIPVGSNQEWLSKFTLIVLAKDSVEQGEWSAQTALKILSGTPPENIPVAKNKRGKLYINLSLAKKLNIKFNESMLNNSEKVE